MAYFEDEGENSAQLPQNVYPLCSLRWWFHRSLAEMCRCAPQAIVWHSTQIHSPACLFFLQVFLCFGPTQRSHLSHRDWSGVGWYLSYTHMSRMCSFKALWVVNRNSPAPGHCWQYAQKYFIRSVVGGREHLWRWNAAAPCTLTLHRLHSWKVGAPGFTKPASRARRQAITWPPSCCLLSKLLSLQ